jgi:hypothetical protein
MFSTLTGLFLPFVNKLKAETTRHRILNYLVADGVCMEGLLLVVVIQRWITE